MKSLLAALEKAQAAAAELPAACHRKPVVRRVANQKIFVFDLETTGPDPEECLAVQIAAMFFQPGQEPQRYSAIINPGVHIPREATAVHKVSTEKARLQPLFVELLPEFQPLIEAADITIAYNGLHFDNLIMKRELAMAESSLTMPPMLDPYVWASWHDKGRGLKLTEICHWHGVSLDSADAHNAEGDTTALVSLAQRMIQAGEIPANVDAALAAQEPIAAFIHLEREHFGGLIYLDRQTAAVRCGGKKHRGKLLREVDDGYIDWCLKLDDLPAGAREVLGRTKQERVSARSAA